MRRFLAVLLISRVFNFTAQVSIMNTALLYELQGKTDPNKYMRMLVEADINKLKSEASHLGIKVNYCVSNLASIECTAAQLSELINLQIVKRAELVPANKVPLNDTMIYKNRIKAVKTGTSSLPQTYDGTGILMGIIDTGVDFNHPDLKDAQGNTRIKFLWDQAATGGSTIPQPYNYGTEWTSNDINANLCTHSDLTYYGHGTGVCGIAAGNGLATGKFEGVASKSDLVVVALDFTSSGPTVADAVNYIVNKATTIGKPFVINASLGNYYGSHDATDLEAKIIENMVTNIPGRVMVAAAGNAGSVKFHTKTQPPLNDTSFTWINTGTTQLGYTCYADTLQIKNVQIAVGANRVNFSDLGRIGFKSYNYALNTIKSDTLYHNNQRIGIVETAASINSYGVYELAIQITADTSNLNWRVESKGNGMHHAWNFDFVSTGLPTLVQHPRMVKHVMPDTLMTMVSSFQCSDEIITVANYVNRSKYYDVNNVLQNTGEISGGLESGSSSGPTRDGRQKPDIAATGNNVISDMALGMQTFLLTNAPQVVAQDSVHVLNGGTSASSPVVAGLAALYLQMRPTATNREIRDAIQDCAYSDNFTGNILPHPHWGYGKLDGLATLLCITPTVAGTMNYSKDRSVMAYPNPFKDEIRIVFQEEMKGALSVYNINGTLVFEDEIHGNAYELNGKYLEGPSQLYLVNIVSAQNTFTFKLLKE